MIIVEPVARSSLRQNALVSLSGDEKRHHGYHQIYGECKQDESENEVYLFVVEYIVETYGFANVLCVAFGCFLSFCHLLRI